MWVIAAILAAAYCVARAVVDLRQKHYAWAVFGLLAAGAILAAPIPTHAVKVDIPINEAGS